MGKVIVPQPNEKELAAFALQGLSMRQSMTEGEFFDMAIEYLNRHNVLHLATCKNNEPRCTPLEYFNNGLTVYIFSEGGGKIANLRVNDLVSYSIADPYDP
jgi:nitroimidazol reductase NimA-like FMN-containing flavoprotein (pyridoxamine 5'-phosphate oxidase superfamily)